MGSVVVIPLTLIFYPLIKIFGDNAVEGMLWVFANAIMNVINLAKQTGFDVVFMDILRRVNEIYEQFH